MSRCDSVSSSRCGIFVPVEVRFEWTNTLPHENALFWGLWDEGFNWHTLQRFIAEYQPPTKPVPGTGPTRLRQEGSELLTRWN